MKSFIGLFLLIFGAFACGQTIIVSPSQTTSNTLQTNTLPKLYLGADLSYVNELEDCKANYQANGKKVEPYQLFQEKGANIVRLRLWHTPEIGRAHV